MKFYVVFFCLAAVTFSSCTSFHQGNISGGSYPPSADYELKQMAYGHAGTFKILGLGGWNTDAIVLEAKRNLQQHYELQPGQAFVNYTVDFKRTLFPFVSTTKVLVSAEVVEPSGPSMASNTKDSAQAGMEAGDEVFLKRGGESWESVIEKAYVLEEKANALKVLWFKEGDRPRVTKITPRNTLLVFRSHMSLEERETYGFNIGDTIAFKTTQFLNDPRLAPGGDEEITRGVVLGKNRNNLFIVDGSVFLTLSEGSPLRGYPRRGGFQIDRHPALKGNG